MPRYRPFMNKVAVTPDELNEPGVHTRIQSQDDIDFWSSLVLKARDGSISYNDAVEQMGDAPPELYEWLRLSLMMEIYVGSPEEQRLNELNKKYETDGAYRAGNPEDYL